MGQIGVGQISVGQIGQCGTGWPMWYGEGQIGGLLLGEIYLMTI
mgnify:CR=1 FL=1